jgi:hypothetical protein
MIGPDDGEPCRKVPMVPMVPCWAAGSNAAGQMIVARNPISRLILFCSVTLRGAAQAGAPGVVGGGTEHGSH